MQNAFSPTAPSQTALPQQAERIDTARVAGLHRAGQQYFDRMPPPRQESVRKTLANILPCKPGAEGMALVLYAVG